MTQKHFRNHKHTQLSKALFTTGISFLLFLFFFPLIKPAVPVAVAQDDPTISFTANSYATNEGVGVFNDVTIQVSPAPTTGVVISVTYATLDATANVNGDYTSASGILTFTRDITQRSIPITIIDDTIVEGSESEYFYVQLTNPQGAPIATGGTIATILIVDNEGAATTPTSGPVYLDAYEPNNSQDTSSDIGPNADSICNLSLWPTLDVDFFRFWGKSGLVYEVFTSELDAGLDTSMEVYGPSGNLIGANDDLSINIRDSKVSFTVDTEGYYFIRIVNEDPSDPANKTYCVQVDELAPPTPTPAATQIPDADPCTNAGDIGNDTFDTACLLELETPIQENFVPVTPGGSDNDYYRIWVKPGIQYTCETSELSSFNDTNIILYNQNREGMWIGNDDKAPGDLGSLVTYISDYQGWLYILVGPVNVPDYEQSYLFTYSIECRSSLPPTATPTATATPLPPSFFFTAVPSNTPFPTPTPTSDISTPVPETAFTPTPEIVTEIQFIPMPTPTPPADNNTRIPVTVILYYDHNPTDFQPQLGEEGVAQTAVALYDNITGNLLAFGYTNNNGVVDFGEVDSSGSILVYVPYLNYTQLIFGNNADEMTSTIIRIAPLNTFSP